MPRWPTRWRLSRSTTGLATGISKAATLAELCSPCLSDNVASRFSCKRGGGSCSPCMSEDAAEGAANGGGDISAAAAPAVEFAVTFGRLALHTRNHEIGEPVAGIDILGVLGALTCEVVRGVESGTGTRSIAR